MDSYSDSGSNIISCKVESWLTPVMSTCSSSKESICSTKPTPAREDILVLVATKLIQNRRVKNLEENQFETHVTAANTRAEMYRSTHTAEHETVSDLHPHRFQEKSNASQHADNMKTLKGNIKCILNMLRA